LITIYKNILFVCTGNTCRSPYAHYQLESLVREKFGDGLEDINISSAGIYAFPGVSPPPNAIRAGKEMGVDISLHKSRAIHISMLESSDIVFCMTSRQKSHLISKYPWFEDKIFSLREYASGKEKEALCDSEEIDYDIPDPIGQGIEVYRSVYAEIRESIEKVINRWENEKEFRLKITKSFKIALGSDHGGYDLKENIKEFLEERGYLVQDFGTYNGDESVDYPDFARPPAESVAKGENDLGILFCGTGLGVNITANKVKGIRAAQCTDTINAKLSRAHNNANILTLGGRTTTPMIAREIVEVWLATPFEGGRHERRVNKIDC